MPETTGWWNELALPEAFIWQNYPVSEDLPGFVYPTNLNAPEFPEQVQALRTWASENGLQVDVFRVRESYGDGVTFSHQPRTIRIARDTVVMDSTEYEWASSFMCPWCEQEHIPYTIYCPTADRNIACASCARTYTTADSLRRISDNSLACSMCVRECGMGDCQTTIETGWYYCEEHGRRAYCGSCDARMEAGVEDDVEWRVTEEYGTVCESCAARICSECDTYSRRGLDYLPETQAYVCRRCWMGKVYGGNEEEFDNDAGMTNRALRIPTIPGRESIRNCGVEIEGANGEGDGENLAQAFYAAGLSTLDTMAGYHHGRGSGFAHVEADSSVDWEAVIGPLNPANTSEVSSLNRALRTIRGMVKDGTLGLDLRAGCHIHVGAEGVSLDGAFNLNTLFSYIEDVIFRLGAARWPVHRAIQDTHYTQPVPKLERKLEFARSHNEEGSRYYALSFSNYFASLFNNCHCGAVRYDSWEDCTCDLGKCTFEFRVFNTTANPRKLHAYLALTQALVAKAMTMGKLSDPGTLFPALAFVPRRFKDMAESEADVLVSEWCTRLEWMFNELPLTDAEKESVAYCIRHSELEQVGEEFINDLLATQQVIEEVVA